MSRTASSRRPWRAWPRGPLGLLVVGSALAVSAAGGVGEIRFAEVSAEWGIAFRHHHCGTGEFYMVETMGSGVVVFDYDGDGDEDLFLVDSGPLPGCEERPRSVLYRNDGGSFVDVTDRAGIAVSGYGMGAVAGDVDGDRRPDLYVTAFGVNQLFRNRGDGTFADVTASAGVGDPLWGTSAAMADTDGDGDLDIYVTNYVDFSLDENPACGSEVRRLISYCHPEVFEPQPDRFFRNRGDGVFDDATLEAGFDVAVGRGLGVVFGDVDADGDQDLYVANDMNANYLFENRGDGTFAEIGLISGVALSDRGHPEAGMGVDWGDLDGDGRPEIMVTHLDQQSNALYSATPGRVFVDRRFPSRLAEASIPKVGFGVAFLDLDNDADLDIAVANGHIIHNVEAWGRGTTFRQRNQIFRNDGAGRFEEVVASGLDVVRSSRGLSAGDLDGDGDLDLVVSNSNEEIEVYRNDTAVAPRWVQVDLVGGPGGVGVGAAVTLTVDGRRRAREVRTASSYLSQNATTLHFGTGAAAAVLEVEVRWPDGRRQRLDHLPAGRRLSLGRAADPVTTLSSRAERPKGAESRDLADQRSGLHPR